MFTLDAVEAKVLDAFTPFVNVDFDVEDKWEEAGVSPSHLLDALEQIHRTYPSCPMDAPTLQVAGSCKALSAVLYETLRVAKPASAALDDPALKKKPLLHVTAKSLGSPYPATTATEYDGTLIPLSHEQLAVWLFDQLVDDRSLATFVLPLVFRCRGLNISPLMVRSALDVLISRHESLRTHVALFGTEPKQLIRNQGLLPPIRFVDANDCIDVDVFIKLTLEEEIQRPFDLSDDHSPLLRALLIRRDRADFVFCLSFHRLIIDESSLAILTNELMALLQNVSAPWTVPLSPAGRYGDFVARTVPLPGKAKEQVQFWANELQDVPPLNFVHSSPPPPLPTYRGCGVKLNLTDPTLLEGLREVRRREKCTPFVVHLAAWFISLLPFARQPHFPLGMYINSRLAEERTTVGQFSNTLPIVGDLRGDPILSGFIQDLKRRVAAALKNQAAPYDVVVREIAARDKGVAPLLEAAIMFEQAEAVRCPGLQIEVLDEVDRGCAEMPLRLHIRASSKDVVAILEYSTDAFDAAAAGTLLRCYAHALQALCGVDGTAPVHSLAPAAHTLPPIKCVPFGPAAPPESGPCLLSVTQRAALQRLAMLGAEAVQHWRIRLPAPKDGGQAALHAALQGLAARHAILRTRATALGQEVLPFTDPEVLQAFSSNPGRTPTLSLSTGKVIAGVVGQEGGQSYWEVVVHGLAADLPTMQQLGAELQGWGASARKVDDLEYCVLAQQEQSLFQLAQRRQAVDHLQARLAGLQPLELPTDGPRPACLANFSVVTTTLPRTICERLAHCAQHHRLGGDALLAAGLGLLLHRTARQGDVAFGVALRPDQPPGARPPAGPITNLVPIRLRLDPNMVLGDFFVHIAKAYEAARPCAVLPIAHAAEALGLPTAAARHPIVTVGLDVAWGPLPVGALRAVGGLQHLDLNFTVTGQWGSQLALRLDYAAALFSPPTADALLQRLGFLCAALAAPPPATRLGDVGAMPAPEDAGVLSLSRSVTHAEAQVPDGLLRVRLTEQPLQELLHRSEEEAAGPAPPPPPPAASIVVPPSLTTVDAATQQRLLVEFQTPDLGHPDELWHELMEAQAARQPGAVAVISGALTLTYAELNTMANQLACYLYAVHRVRLERAVALFLERGLEIPVAIFAVLKAGGQYVPLDPHSTAVDRHRFVVQDCDCATVITQPAYLDQVNSLHPTPVVINTQHWEYGAYPKANPKYPCTPWSLCYTIYTSGSTGTPKGVQLPHRNIAHLHRCHPNFSTIGPGCVYLQTMNYTFDASLSDWSALSAGATMCFIRPEGATDLAHLDDLVRRHGVTHCQFVPTLLDGLLSVGLLRGWTTMRDIGVGGEALKPSTMRELRRQLPTTSLYNAYGPTETSDYCTSLYCCLTDPMVTIGRTRAGARIYILDDCLRLVDIGVDGEIMIGGDRLPARGYHKRPGLTAEKFVADPFAGVPGARMYHSGDIGRWMPNGEVYYIGRCDSQVKVRGFRIELGEVEVQLARGAGLEQCVVLCEEGVAGPELVCYYTGSVIANVEDQLPSMLPRYMVPARFIHVPQFPLLQSGKVDRKKLGRTPAPPPPSPPPARAPAPEPATAAPSPVKSAEEAVVAAFASVLGLPRVGRQDNFLHLGGNSMTAALVAFRIQARLRTPVTLLDVLEHLTPAALAAHLKPHGPAPSTTGRAATTQHVQTHTLGSERSPPKEFPQQRRFRREPYPPGETRAGLPVTCRIWCGVANHSWRLDPGRLFSPSSYGHAFCLRISQPPEFPDSVWTAATPRAPFWHPLCSQSSLSHSPVHALHDHHPLPKDDGAL